MNVVPADLRLSALRALLGAIHPEVRLVKVKLLDNKIVMTTIADKSLSDDCAEALSIAATEVIADFPECDLEERVIVSTDPLPRESIFTEGWVFQRAEG